MVDTRYRVKAGSVFSFECHVVWCPQYRKSVLTGTVERRLRVLLNSKAQEPKATIHAMEFMSDHVHLFVASDPTKAPAPLVAPFVAPFKGFTAHSLRQEFPWLKSRLPRYSRLGDSANATHKRYVAEQKTRA